MEEFRCKFKINLLKNPSRVSNSGRVDKLIIF